MLTINESDVQALQNYADSGVEEIAKGQKYPALQVNQYRNLKLSTKLSFCFAEDSWKLIPDVLKVKFDAQFEEVYYDKEAEDEEAEDKKTEIYKIDYVRFIPLAIPKLFKENKASKVVSSLTKFVPGDRTIAKLFLAVVIKDEILTLEDGTPLIVTLKLRSFKTQEIIGEENEPGTLKNLSAELSKKKIGKAGRSNVHFVNLEIVPVSKVYENKAGEKSRGVSYELKSAKINTPANMAVISLAFQDKELLETMADPFRLKAPTGELEGNDAKGLILEDIIQTVRELGLKDESVQKFLVSRFGVTSLDRLTVDELLEAKGVLEAQPKNGTNLDDIPF